MFNMRERRGKMAKKKSYWKKFEELHGFLLAAGAVLDYIHLKPRSYDRLNKELTPIQKLPDGFTSELTGAVTNFGPVKIMKDWPEPARCWI